MKRKILCKNGIVRKYHVKHLKEFKKKYLYNKKKRYWEHKTIHIPPTEHFYRYSLIQIWSCEDNDIYFPQLEIKTFIFTKKKLSKPEKELNALNKQVKTKYDYKNFFEFELTRKRTAYEFEEITYLEYDEHEKFTIITVWDNEDTIRNNYPATEFH